MLDVIRARGARPGRGAYSPPACWPPATAASGMNDWADTTAASDAVRLIGAVPAVAKVAGRPLQMALDARRHRDWHRRGVALSMASIGALSTAVGGHLSLRRALGADQTFEFGPYAWTDVLDDSG